MDSIRTAVASTPVITTSDMKLRLKVEFTEDDNYIAALIQSATNYCQNYARRQFITTTFQAFLDCWPCCDCIYLDYPPLVAVQSIQYTAPDGEPLTWDAGYYHVYTKAHKGFIYSTNRPNHISLPQAITINYTAGFGTAATNVPADIITAVEKLVEHQYTNREAVVIGTITGDLAFSVHALLDNYRVAEAV